MKRALSLLWENSWIRASVSGSSGSGWSVEVEGADHLLVRRPRGAAPGPSPTGTIWEGRRGPSRARRSGRWRSMRASAGRERRDPLGHAAAAEVDGVACLVRVRLDQGEGVVVGERQDDVAGDRMVGPLHRDAGDRDRRREVDARRGARALHADDPVLEDDPGRARRYRQREPRGDRQEPRGDVRTSAPGRRRARGRGPARRRAARPSPGRSARDPAGRRRAGSGRARSAWAGASR